MKAEDVPQEEWISGHGRRACYAEDESGRYVVVASSGWEVERIVNSQAHDQIRRRLREVRREVREGAASPLKYHMESAMMDAGLLASTTGLWKFQVRRHLKPRHFAALDRATLERYAAALRISVEELRSLPDEEGCGP
ncbi:MAG TPA: hypothetical protein VI078_15110 [bacterium]